MRQRTRRKRRPALVGKESIQSSLRSLLPVLHQRYRVRSLALFGSAVRDEMHARSDIDLLVEFDDADNPVSLLDFIELRNYLSDELGCRVDLVEPHTLRPAYRSTILHEAEPV